MRELRTFQNDFARAYGALAAVETALLDLRARRPGVPLLELLWTKVRDAVPVVAVALAAVLVAYLQLEYAADACPGGEGRAFGPCEADRGVIVQEWAGDTHVVAVALDLTVVGGDRRVETTLVVRAVGGIDRGWRP